MYERKLHLSNGLLVEYNLLIANTLKVYTSTHPRFVNFISFARCFTNISFEFEQIGTII